MTQCNIDQCHTDAKVNGYCKTHYERIWRTGSPELKTRAKGTGSIRNGYLVIVAKDHPLAKTEGRVYAHRVALYDHIGSGVHQCHHCPTLVEWENGTLKVDHLDHNRLNNDIANLVPSCNRCNAERQVRAAA